MTDPASPTPDLSIVVPMHDEAESVGPLHAELVAALGQLDQTAELIFIDDGSTDDTFDRLRELHRRQRDGDGTPGMTRGMGEEPDTGESSSSSSSSSSSIPTVEGRRVEDEDEDDSAEGRESGDEGAGGVPAVKVLRLRRRFGKSAALTAGFEQARGDVIITMDGDLQDAPKEIPRFLDKLAEGCDLVSGWKRERRDPLAKTIPSRIFNVVVALATGIKIHDFNCGFKAYRRELVNELHLYGDLHRYVPVLAHAKGYRCGEIEVEHRPRVHGRTKYGLGRLFTSFLDLLTVLLLTSYASRPLHFFGGTGLVAFFAGFVVSACLAVLWCIGERPIGNRPLLFLGVLLLILGIQLISVGLIGELVISRQGRRGDGFSIAESLE